MKLSEIIDFELIKRLCNRQIERTNTTKLEGEELSYELGAKAMACVILSELKGEIE